MSALKVRLMKLQLFLASLVGFMSVFINVSMSQGGLQAFAATSSVAGPAALGSAASETSQSFDRRYVAEIDGLLSSLPRGDAQIPPLRLKLADALFSEAQALLNKSDPSSDDRARELSDRRRAEAIYESSLASKNAKPSQQARIRFQLARLYSDDGRSEAAEKIWRALAEDSSDLELQRETLLRLAELDESRTGEAALARAEHAYRKALALCETPELCSYCHYRLAWVWHAQHRSKEAIAEIQNSLWSDRNKLREEPLRDLISFMAETSSDGSAEIKQIEAIAERSKRPELVQALADAFLASGNKSAAILALENVQARRPSQAAQIRLLEEVYGVRDWAKFDRHLKEANLQATLPAPKGDPDFRLKPGNTESEKVLRRLIVQLDGERETRPEAASAFKGTTDLYLRLFPQLRPERRAMIEGWLAAETDSQIKLDRLATWIAEDHASGDLNLERTWRQARASVAQKTGDLPALELETKALARIAESPEKREEALYQNAYALYLDKKDSEALLEFQKLARVSPSLKEASPPLRALQSEHLALDILARAKSFARVVEQARAWTSDSRFSAWEKAAPADQKKQYADLGKIESSAEFEQAASAGVSETSLAVFDRDCQKGLFLPKSCDDARAAAARLKDEAALLRSLKAQNRQSELAAEFEASGDFASAAKIAEAKLAKDLRSSHVGSRTHSISSAVLNESIKVALLYELAGDLKARDRILTELKPNLRRKIDANESLIYLTLRDAGLIDEESLRLAWSPDIRRAALEYLASLKTPSKVAVEELKRSCRDSGPAWEKLALEELRRLDRDQTAIVFVGKPGRARFKKRLSALKLETDRGDCYLQDSRPAFRAVAASGLARSQKSVSDEIASAPIPREVDAAARARLQAAIAQMAQPFKARAEQFEKIASEQLPLVSDAAEREALAKAIDPSNTIAFQVPPRSEVGEWEADAESSEARMTLQASGSEIFSAQERSERAAALAELAKAPDNPEPLSALRKLYLRHDENRLAAYFEGRLKKTGATQASASGENSDSAAARDLPSKKRVGDERPADPTEVTR